MNAIINFWSFSLQDYYGDFHPSREKTDFLSVRFLFLPAIYDNLCVKEKSIFHEMRNDGEKDGKSC